MSARLSMGLVAVALLVFSTAGSFLLWTLEHELQRSQAELIESKAEVVKHLLKQAVAPRDLRQSLDETMRGETQWRLWFVQDDGVVLYGGSRRPSTEELGEGRLWLLREDDAPLRGKSFRIAARPGFPGGELLIGLDVQRYARLLSQYRNLLLLICGLGLVLTAGLGAWVTRQVLDPMRQLSREAAALTPDILSHRLKADDAADELQSLVSSFNLSLDRVQAAYEHLELFSAEVAHELRTPLATMISGTEVTLARTRSNEELTEALVSNLEELQQLATMVNDMLFLAKADRGGWAGTLEIVDLAEQARQVGEYFEATLDEHGQTFRVEGAAQAFANAALLRRALVNLVGNAVRYTAAGQQITVEVRAGVSSVRVAVRNPGPDVDSALLAQLFDRVFRADPARRIAGDSHGLGLAIVRGIARMHGGETFARSVNGITEVGFTLAVSASSDSFFRRPEESRPQG